MFAGQGAQAVGMGRDLAETSAVAREVYARASQVLGFDLAALCFDGPEERLNRTDISQPAIFATSVAFWRTLEHVGTVARLNAEAVAGLSLGEYTALHVAGALSFEDGIRLVAERGRLMQVASDSSRGGMVSIMGMDEAQVSELCRRAAGPDEFLAPANFNCPGQIVVSGSLAACDRVLELADSLGGRATRLAVSGAFHSPLMAPAAEGLAAALAATPIRPPDIRVVSNVSADYYAGPEDIGAQLRRQVTSPIRWQNAMQRLIQDGFRRFVEIGPGRVLSGLMRKIDRTAKTVNYSTAASLEQSIEAA